MHVCANENMTKIKQKVKFYKALGEENRLKIIKFLLTQDSCSCICHLSKKLKKDQSVIFRHIQILKDAEIVSTRKKDKFLYCCLKNKKEIKKLLGD